MKRILRDERGSVAVIFALTLPVVAAVAAVALDYKSAANVRSDLQTTADSAALAGVQELLNANHGTSQSQSNAKEMAAKYASTLAAEASQQISSTIDTVTVELSQNQATYFGGILQQQSIPLKVRAVATIMTLPNACMLALGKNEPIGIGLVGSAKINAPDCLIQSNSTSPTSIKTQGAANLDGWKVCTAGGTSGVNSSPPPERCSDSKDPYASRQLQNEVGACNFNDKKVKNHLAALTPGVYCGGLDIQSADVTLAPGLYVIKDGPLSMKGNSTLTGAAASILLSGSGAILDLQGNSIITLVAMQAGALEGIAIASDTPGTPILTSSLQGTPKLNLTGSMYLPNQRLKLQGNPSVNVLGGHDAMIALSFDMQGSPEILMSSKDKQGQGTAYAGPRLMR